MEKSWRTIHLHGAAAISRVVNTYEVWDFRGIPWAKYKVKVLECAEGDFLAVANVRIKDEQGVPDGTAGLGQTEVEAFQDLVQRMGEILSARKTWRPEDFEWSDPHDF